jgi:glucan 1,3-beta-glucosidase
VPVTYADVWEFWLRYRSLASAVDFITIHILPYWEDDPVAARDASEHVDAIRKRAVESFAGKEVVIGEVGWPSEGRMRHGALPSPSNEARVLAEVLTRGKHERFHVNIIEAFDQPWKRVLEGTVGGYWGLFDDGTRTLKFFWGQPVSNHSYWRWQASVGLLLAAFVFTVAIQANRNAGSVAWIAVAIDAAIGGVLIGWTIENVVIASLGIGGWLRSIALALIAATAPVAAAAGLVLNRPLPSFAEIIGPKAVRSRDPLVCLMGALLIALSALAVQSALSLVFDPRYRDFPFTSLTGAAVPFVLLGLVAPRVGSRPLAESAAAATLMLCAIVVVWNETIANWQALWFGLSLLLVAVSLVRARVARD